MDQSELPTDLAAYQNQCFNDRGEWTGFRCPNNNPNCPLKRGDKAPDTRTGLSLIRGQMELAHLDNCRFSQTRSTKANQVIAKCIDCHTREHANDASACRGKRS